MVTKRWSRKMTTSSEAGHPPLILHVAPHFRPAYAFGGPPAMSSLMTSALAAEEYRIVVWTTNVADQTGRRLPSGSQLEDGVTVNRYSYLSKPAFRFSNILITPGMTRDSLIGDLRPSLVHLHDFRSLQAISAYTLALRRHRPLLLQPRGTLGIMGKKRVKQVYDRTIGRRLLEYAYRVLALTPEEANAFLSWGVPESKVTVVPNGIPIPTPTIHNRRGAFRKRFGIDNGSFMILFMGGLRESKGVRLLLDAFEHFSIANRNATLVFCGADEGMAQWISEQSKKKGLHVITPGFLTGDTKTEALIDSDVFCLPSFGEAQSIALLEAASFGLPIVASKVGAPSSFAELNAGIFVELDPIEIAGALAQLANSENGRRELGRKARKLVADRYSLESTLTLLRDLYRETLQSWDN